MKELNLTEMQSEIGGDLDFLGGLACAGSIFAGAAVLAGTGGAGAVAGLFIASQGCAHYIGYSLFVK